jgi:hypothetical protein
MRNAAKFARPLLIGKLLVTDTKYALGLFADEGKLTRRWKGVESERFFLEGIFICWSRQRLACLELLSGGKCDHKVNSRNFSSNNILGTKVFGKTAKDLL